MNFGEGRKFTFHDLEVPLEEFGFGLLCEEFGHDPIVKSSLL